MMLIGAAKDVYDDQKDPNCGAFWQVKIVYEAIRSD
jgi:hypothetical protein